jgi:hypothetical protein
VKHKTSRDLTTGLRKLATASVPTQNLERHWGVIQGVSADGTVALTMGGSSQTVTGVKVLASYSPVVGDTVMLDVVGSDVVVVGTLGAPRGPLGELSYVEVASPQTGITAQTNVTGLSRTVILPPSRKIKVTACVPLAANNTNGAGALLYLVEGATQLAVIAEYSPSAGNAFGLTAIARLKPSAGTHTYQAQMAAVGGTAVTNANIQVAFMLIEDIGPA